MRARDLMTAKPFVVAPTDSVSKAAEVMRYHNVGGVPVVEGGTRPRLVGLVTDRDLTVRFVARGHHGPCQVREVMTPAPLVTVHAEAGPDEIVTLMEARSVRRLPVVSDDGALIGIVAEADLCSKLPPEVALPLRKRLKHQAASATAALLDVR